MPKRSRKQSSKPRPSKDPNVAAFNLVQQIIESGESKGKNPLAVALGRLGGLKGGKARAEKLSKQQLRASAVNAANARWRKTVND